HADAPRLLAEGELDDLLGLVLAVDLLAPRQADDVAVHAGVPLGGEAVQAVQLALGGRRCGTGGGKVRQRGQGVRRGGGGDDGGGRALPGSGGRLGDAGGLGGRRVGDAQG